MILVLPLEVLLDICLDYSTGEAARITVLIIILEVLLKYCTDYIIVGALNLW